MKKTHLIAAIGTLALVANLVLPGLVFAQTEGTVTITCPAGHNINWYNPTGLADIIPANFNFDSVTLTYDDEVALDSVQDGFSPEIASFPATTKLAVTGRTVAGCTDSENDWNVTVSAEDLDNSEGGGTSTIAATSVKVATGFVIDGVTCSNATELGVTEQVCYVDYGSGPAQDTATAIAGQNTTDGTPGGMDVASGYGLEIGTAPVTIMSYTDATGDIDGLNGEAYIGVGFAIDNGIAWNQESGTYKGTITYTLNTPAP